MRLVLPLAVVGTLSLAAGLPGIAAAAPVRTLFVDHNVTCSDTGTGALALPFCTIAAAERLTQPGDQVTVDPNPGDPVGDTYAAGLTVDHSGTDAQPIVFTTGKPERNGTDSVLLDGNFGGQSRTGPGITFSASRDVTFDGIGLTNVHGSGVVVQDSSRITVTHAVIDTTAGVDVDVTGISNGVTVTKNWLATPNGTGNVVVRAGASGTLLSDNVITMPNTVSPSVLVAGATGTTIANDTLTPASAFGCPTPVRVDTAATNTTLENNALLPLCLTVPVIDVAADSTPSTSVDFNNVGQGSDSSRYAWGGTDFATPAAFTAATGQGAHDLANNQTVDSADPAAPGVPATDVLDHARVDDPLVANQFGSIVDRGAQEAVDPLNTTLVMSATQAPTGGEVDAFVQAQNGWGPATSVTVDFGDGTKVTSPTASSHIGHQYSVTGTFRVVASSTDQFGTSVVSPVTTITIVPPAPEVAKVELVPQGGQGVLANELVSTDSWNITQFSCDFGDGTPVAKGPQCIHNYTKLGTYTVTVTIIDAGDNRATTTATFTTAGARFRGIAPTRLLDTRNGTGTGGTVAKVPSGHTVALRVAGVAGIPVTAKAVVLNVTVTNPATGGDVIVYPDGLARPTVSTVNFDAGQTVPNLTVVPIGADGSVDLTAVGGPLDLVADATGYFVGDSTANGFTSVPSHRLLDTRNGTGHLGPIAAHGTLPLTVTGVGGVPVSGVTAVALNVTVTGATQGGFITAFPDGTARPGTSSVNFGKGETVANLVIVPVASDGQVDLFNGSPGTTQLVADVVGYFRAIGGDTYVPLTPSRAFDTRTTTPIPPRTIRTEPLPTVAHPAGVVLNVTVTRPQQGGFVLAAPAPLPAGFNLNAASTLNWSRAGQTLANLAIPATATTSVSIYNGSAGTTHVIGDVLGYFDADTPQS